MKRCDGGSFNVLINRTEAGNGSEPHSLLSRLSLFRFLSDRVPTCFIIMKLIFISTCKMLQPDFYKIKFLYSSSGSDPISAHLVLIAGDQVNDRHLISRPDVLELWTVRTGPLYH